MNDYILVINPGSTSTKIAVFDGKRELFRKNLKLSDSQLDLPLFPDQYKIRKNQILDTLKENDILPRELRAVAARGGRLKPLASGVYRVNERMVEDALKGLQGVHASNTAVVIAKDLEMEFGVPGFTVDPISVDEMEDWARITGIRKINRNSLSHALNMKAVAKKTQNILRKRYEDLRLIVAHLGGGSSISAHLNGRMVDLYNSDKEGPFSVERAGALPTHELSRFSGENDDYMDVLTHKGGLYSHFNTRDVQKIVEMAENNDPEATTVLEAYVYNIAKYMFSFLAVFDGVIDAFIITGGVIKSEYIKKRLEKKLGNRFRIICFPGEFEMETLVAGVDDVLNDKIIAKEY